MDFNQLYFDHQIFVMNARYARSPARRDKLELKASVIAGHISRSQHQLGAAAAPGWQLLAGVR